MSPTPERRTTTVVKVAVVGATGAVGEEMIEARKVELRDPIFFTECWVKRMNYILLIMIYH